MTRGGASSAADGPSRSKACTASTPPGAAYLAWNTTRAAPVPGAEVNQNSSVQPVRRYLTSGPNGPADAAMASKTPCPASARSVARAGSHSARRQTGVRGAVRRLSRTRTAPPARIPA